MTLDSKVSALRSRTSEVPSAATRAAKAKADAAGMKVDRRIVGQEKDDERNEGEVAFIRQAQE